MNDEITADASPDQESETLSPAVVPDISVQWNDLSLEQRLDLIARNQEVFSEAVNALHAKVDWIANTIQGIVNMAGAIKPGDIFKMLKGGGFGG